MKKYIIGKKIGMTEIIEKNGELIPVTIVKLEKNIVIDKKNKENNGYKSVVVGYGDIKEKKLNKPKKGYFKKLEIEPTFGIKEFRTDDVDSFDKGQVITSDIFEVNEVVDVKGKSSGKGFAGTIKRWNFSRGPMTHGSKNHRQPGSTSGGTDPARVFKGKKMAGRMGNKYVTIRNLSIIRIENENNLIFLKGSVPGKKNRLLEIYN